MLASNYPCMNIKLYPCKSTKNHSNILVKFHPYMPAWEYASKELYQHEIIPAYHQPDLIVSRRPTRHERRENLPAYPVLFA